MNKFPKDPQDFVAMSTPFNDDDIETLLDQDIKDVVKTIDSLKTREVNSTNSLMELRNKIEKILETKKIALESAKNIKFDKLIEMIEGHIAILENLV